MPKKKPKYNKNKVKGLRQKLSDSQKYPPMNRAKKEMSSLERIVADMLDELKLEYEREKHLKL